MTVGIIVMVGLSLASTAQIATSAPAQQYGCAQALTVAALDGAAREICAGDDAVRLANAPQSDGADKVRLWTAATEHYRRAVRLTSDIPTKVLALNLLVGTFDSKHLNDPEAMESALLEWISLTPAEIVPMHRLAALQEDQGLIEAAESTLLDARHRQPDAVEPYRQLAQFYARRVTALHAQDPQKKPEPVTSPGEVDEHGGYRVGGAVKPPARLGMPQYPIEAEAAGIAGAVVLEVVIDTAGNVTDPKVVRSIPLLDEAALQAVRDWRFSPTVVNGEPVPVRMEITVTFNTR